VRAVIYGSREIRTLKALAVGLCSLGWSITWREDRDAYKAKQEGPLDFDLAVTEGIRGPMGVMCGEYTALGIPVLISDAGFVRRDLHYFQLGANRLNWFPDFDVPGDRWKRLDVLLRPHHAGTYILITGQKPGDAAHGLSTNELQALYHKWAQELRKLTERPVRFRPHPRGPEARPDALEAIPWVSLAEDLAGAHALVTWNSTSATDALIAGTPAFVLGPNAQAEELANTDLQFIAAPYFPEDPVRRDFFHRVAYAQWTLEELQDGTALEFTLGAIASQGPSEDLRT